MSIHYEDDSVVLHHGDCLEVMRTLPDASVDAVVCDPPYGLSNTDPAHVADTLVRWVNGERDYLPPVKGGFMGQEWDSFVPPVAVWDECYRVLKPGGHVLAFAGSRTHDLMTLGIRLAGFDIRDSIAWLYGSGFPKSLDVSKAIDKRRDWSLVERLSGEIKRARAEAGMSLAEIGQATLDATDGTYGKWYHRGGHMFFETGRSLPSRPEWEHLRHVLPIAPEFVEVYDEAEREVTGQHGAGNPIGMYEFKHGEGKGRTANERRDIPATPDAERWQGWGTALKPAFEPVVVARKPLAGTVAQNVLQHGTGALNIDGCRVGDEGGTRGSDFVPNDTGIYNHGFGGRVTIEEIGKGRWPTNVVLDESQSEVLDQQSGQSASRANRVSDERVQTESSSYGIGQGRRDPSNSHTDSGGASRFFPTFRYEAKAPKSERPKVNGTAHPTVKPLELCRWLVRLVTPPGGTVLEPFAGSGTTVEACVVEGFKCVAIEKTDEYLPLITQRINRQRNPVAYMQAAGDDLGLFDLEEDTA